MYYSQIVVVYYSITGNFRGVYISRNAREGLFLNFILCEWTNVVQVMLHFCCNFVPSVFGNEIATIRQTKFLIKLYIQHLHVAQCWPHMNCKTRAAGQYNVLLLPLPISAQRRYRKTYVIPKMMPA